MPESNTWKPFDQEADEEVTVEVPAPAASPYDPKTLAWRKEQFSKVGYDQDWANFLANSRIDLHTVQDWAEIGTDLAVIVRVLAGTDFLGVDPSFDWDTYDQLVTR